MIEWEDQNYVEEVAKLGPALAGAPSGTDVEGMRKWLLETRISRKPLARRFRTEVKINYADVEIQYDGGEYSLRVHIPEIPPNEALGKRPALIFYHGGGWIHGDAEGDHDLADFFASELQAVIFNVNYRLSPENKFPIPLDDCYHVISWIIDSAERYNVDIDRIGLWGCSAGANLAAAVTLRDCSEHNPSRIRHAMLVVPVTCDPDYFPEPLKQKLANASSTVKRETGEIKKIWEMYGGEKSSDPFCSVLLAPIPAHHPNVHVSVAGRDLLRDEGVAYVQKLRANGVDCQMELYPGVPHGLTLAPAAIVAKQFFRDQARLMNAAFNPNW